MDKIILTTKLSVDDYIKINYQLFYRKWAVKIMTGFGFFLLILIVFLFGTLEQFPWLQLTFGLFLTIGLPISVYFSAKKNYKSNKRISETVNYEFDKENIITIGESFNSKLTWDKIYGVTESNDWILIWQNRQVANVVPKRDFKVGELQKFKDIVKSHIGLKNKLKK